VVRPRSRCPQCGHQLAWFENIPVVSWLALRARCRCCDEPISSIYPLGEIAVGLLWALCAARWGATFTALRVAVFLTILTGIALTDLRHYVIPDGFTVTGLIWTLSTALLAPFIAETVLFAGPYDAVVGACAGAGFIAVIGWLGEVVLKKEAMGMGDMTLMAFVGAAVGPGKAIATVFLGASLGAVVFLLIVYPVALLRRGRVATRARHVTGGDAARALRRLPGACRGDHAVVGRSPARQDSPRDLICGWRGIRYPVPDTSRQQCSFPETR
jgi:leader peptidase (prepilin peptidase)/N-methyltransferase